MSRFIIVMLVTLYVEFEPNLCVTLFGKHKRDMNPPKNVSKGLPFLHFQFGYSEIK